METAPLRPPAAIPSTANRLLLPPIRFGSTDRAVVLWLWVVYAFVFFTLLVGGVTRLTGSGLSMVEWQPLMGVVPPLDEASWRQVFDQYKDSPQYVQVNHWMTLQDFKRIYFWEYLHRLSARLIGLVFFVPWLAFVLTGRLRGRLAGRALVAFALGGAQGLLGWFMVRSGLVDVPSVSHLRLAAHFLLAGLIGCWVLWMILDLSAPVLRSVKPLRRGTLGFAWGLVAALAVQLLYGAFMAGTRAGFMYPTFPTMQGEWIPKGVFMGALSTDLFMNPVTIHFMHRLLGWALLLGVAALWFVARPGAGPRVRPLLVALVTLTGVQFALGVFTVVLRVPTVIAVAHQAVGFALLSVAVAVVHALRGERPGGERPGGERRTVS